MARQNSDSKRISPGEADKDPAVRPETGEAAGGAGADKPRNAPERPDPTRYGDWEKNGRCIDF